MTTDATAAAMDPIYRAEFLRLLEHRLGQARAAEHQAAERLANRVAEVQAHEALIAALEHASGLRAFGPRLYQAATWSEAAAKITTGSRLITMIEALTRDLAVSAQAAHAGVMGTNGAEPDRV